MSRIKLIISGGGTRGIYQVGVLHALEEYGLLEDVASISGCSIGAINATFLLQYQPREIKDIWNRFSRIPFFKNVNHNSRLYPLQLMKETILNKGLETDTLKRILNDCIDEKTVRQHPAEYIISTYNATKNIAEYFTLDSIPENQLISHIIASARLPIFKAEVINENVYLDGGFVDNEPHVSFLEDKHFDLLIRIKTVHVSRYISSLKMENISFNKQVIIKPSGKLGFPLNFKNPSFDERFKMGYLDGINACQNLGI